MKQHYKNTILGRHRLSTDRVELGNTPVCSCSQLRLSLYAKVWFSFRVLANLAGKTHKSAPNLVQIEQIPRYHPHTPKTPQSFIFEAIQTSASHGGNPIYHAPSSYPEP